MKTLAISIQALVLTAGAASAGDLTPPPGAPTSTFKTLQQVEPRTPIQSVAGSGLVMHNITQPGSYYLTGNLVVGAGGVGIQVSADNVTIDLNGFTISGVGASMGINVPATRRYLTVKNGVVRDFGGVCIDASNVVCGHFEGLAVRDSGGNNGIEVGSLAVVRAVRAESNNVAGIVGSSACTFTDCIAFDNGGDGLSAGSYATVTSCTSLSNGGDGITSAQRSTVTNCSSNDNFLDGFEMSFGGVIKNCTAAFNQQGIRVDAGGAVLILENECSNNSDSGILVSSGSANRIERNHVGFNDNGLAIITADNFIVANTARGNATNFAVAAGNESGAVVTSPGLGFSNSNPWANFAY
jgi:parallel beta-helix repeat protein